MMKKTYHLCISSDDEVMFRDEEDYNRGFNSFALALYKTGSTGLVESFMSTHAHLLVQSDDPDRFMGVFRMPYAKYFNNKYSRKGRLGEEGHFSLEIHGLHHHLAAISYILRNGLHHGVAPIPYAYPHCSVNAIFQKEMGKSPAHDLLPSRSYYRHIGRKSDYPETYKMSSSGLFLRESVLDIPQVENMFVTPRTVGQYHEGTVSIHHPPSKTAIQNRHPKPPSTPSIHTIHTINAQSPGKGLFPGDCFDICTPHSLVCSATYEDENATHYFTLTMVTGCCWTSSSG